MTFEVEVKKNKLEEMMNIQLISKFQVDPMSGSDFGGKRRQKSAKIGSDFVRISLPEARDEVLCQNPSNKCPRPGSNVHSIKF